MANATRRSFTHICIRIHVPTRVVYIYIFIYVDDLCWVLSWIRLKSVRSGGVASPMHLSRSDPTSPPRAPVMASWQHFGPSLHGFGLSRGRLWLKDGFMWLNLKLSSSPETFDGP